MTPRVLAQIVYHDITYQDIASARASKWETKFTNAINIDVIKANIDKSYIGYKKKEVELIQKDIRFSDFSTWTAPRSWCTKCVDVGFY